MTGNMVISQVLNVHGRIPGKIRRGGASGPGTEDTSLLEPVDCGIQRSRNRPVCWPVAVPRASMVCLRISEARRVNRSFSLGLRNRELQTDRARIKPSHSSS